VTHAPRRSLDAGRSGDWLTIALVVISYVTTFGVPLPGATPLHIAVLIGAGVAYTLIGTYGVRYCERTRAAWAYIAYFCVQIALGSAIVYLSQGRGMLIVLSLVGQSVDWLARRWAIVSYALVSLADMLAVVLVLSNQAGSLAGRLQYVRSAPFWEIMLPILLQYLLASGFVVILTQIAVREREARRVVEVLAAELAAANRKLRQYATQVEELSAVKERNRLAREIHDGLGHYLTAINMQIRAGRAVLEQDPARGLDALDKAQGLAHEGLAEVRRSVSTLRASPLDSRTLVDAVGELVDACRTAGIATGYRVRGEERALAPQVGLALYRAAQEATTNLCRHAQASSAEVTLDYDTDRVRLVVADGGVGSADPAGGYGLLGIRERVSLLGGSMRVETAPGEGFTLAVEVPG
jgi:signal transduction histidine kinase